jgi:hypothetical protein
MALKGSMTIEASAKPLLIEDVEFSEASPQQREASWRLNAVSWRGPLTLEEYLGRETHLANQELTKENGICWWVVSFKSKPLEIVASCETIQKSVLAADQSAGFRCLRGYAIASVYTNPTYRKMGMATFLISSLRSWFDNDGSADVSVLYSDIGPVSLTGSKARLMILQEILCESWMGRVSSSPSQPRDSTSQ